MLTTKFTQEYETKNKIRFHEASDNKIIETLYITKAALKELGYKDSDVITVTISKEEK